jgi:hypothetical protein
MAEDIREALAYRLIGQPELAEQLQRAMELKGDTPQLVAPVLGWGVQADDYTREEYWWLRRGTRFCTSANVAAVAGQKAYHQLGRPVAGDRSSIAVTESITLVNQNAAGMLVYIGLQAYPALSAPSVVNIGNMDDRQAANVSAAFQLSSGTSAAPGTFQGSHSIFLAQGQVAYLPLRYILTGNLLLSIIADVANLSLLADLVWRERALLSSER